MVSKEVWIMARTAGYGLCWCGVPEAKHMADARAIEQRHGVTEPTRRPRERQTRPRPVVETFGEDDES